MSSEQEESKRCGKCKETKAVSEFSKNRACNDGLRSMCRVCDRAALKARRERNAARNAGRAIDPNYEKRCPDCGEVKTAVQFNRNISKMDGLQAMCKECSSARNSKWQRNNPDKRRARDQKRRALKANAEGSFTADEWKFTLMVLDYRCIYCNIHKDDTPEKWLEADHLTPLYRGGTNYIDNIAPACRSCNASKGTKTFDEFIDHLVETGKL